MRPKRSRPAPDEPAALRALALRLLAGREHTRLELQRKLRLRGCDGERVAQLLDGLSAEGLLSDERFAEVFSRSRLEKGYGPHRIEAELRERGVAEALIAAVLDRPEAFWCELAARQRGKRFGERLPSDPHERARQARFLHQRGFTGEQIRCALRGEVARL
jgi:regulatory protein